MRTGRDTAQGGRETDRRPQHKGPEVNAKAKGIGDHDATDDLKKLTANNWSRLKVSTVSFVT